mgnify:CR=1 FL=1
MTSIKPYFILYLLISSLALSICKKVTKQEDCIQKEENLVDSFKNIFDKMPKNVLEKLGYFPAIPASVAMLSNADKIIISLEKFFGSIGTGIKYTYSSLYASIEAAYGIKAAAAFSIGNYAIILVGATYLIYKMVDKDHYIKVGDIEYSSKDKNKKYDNK